MGRKAFLICFSVDCDKFESNYERNKFFRCLYGWRQVVRKDEKVYAYERNGLLDEIPHLKVDQSSFIVPEDHVEKIIKFLEEWEDKVVWKIFKVILEENIFK